MQGEAPYLRLALLDENVDNAPLLRKVLNPMQASMVI